MAGLLQKPGMMQSPSQPPMQGQTPPGQGAAMPQEEQSNVSQEEQAEYERFVTNGMEMIYEEKVMESLIKNIRGAADPIKGLGDAVAVVVMRLEDAAAEAGAEISGDIRFHGGLELTEQMAELAQQAGIHEYTEAEIEGAFYAGVDTYRMARQEEGKLPEQEINGDMMALVEADKQGQLDQLLTPGITEYGMQNQPVGEGQQPMQSQAPEQMPSRGLMRG